MATLSPTTMTIIYHIASRTWGGGEQYVFDLAGSLSQQQHRCLFVVAPGCEQVVINRLSTLGQVIVVKGLQGLRRYLPSTGRELLALIEQYHADVVHVNSRQAYFAAAWAKRHCSRPLRLVATQHLVRPAKDNFLWRRIYRRFDSLICVSELVRDTYCGNADLFSDVRVIRNSIRVDSRYTSAATKTESRQSPVIFYHGRICREKGIYRLVEALSLLTDLDFRLCLAGNIPEVEREQVVSYLKSSSISGRIVMLGFRDDIPRLCHSATLGVVPTIAREAGGPLVLLENMAYRLPTITTNNGSQAEIVSDGESALLYSPDDIRTLAAHVRRLLTDPALRTRLADNASQLFSLNFRYSDFLQRTFDTYQQQEGHTNDKSASAPTRDGVRRFATGDRVNTDKKRKL